jgi:hypothetical protein
MALNLLDGDRKIEVRDCDLKDVDGGDEATVYVVRQIPPAVNREYGKRHTTQVINRKSGSREPVVDSMGLVDDLLDYALIEWRGVLMKGEPAPCTRELKDLLDYPRKVALLGVAGLNQVDTEARDHSFRSSPKV